MAPRKKKRVRVSQHYSLDRSQGELEFVDVAIDADSRLFVDPRAFRALNSDWGDSCVDLIHEFFSEVLLAIHREEHDRARLLLRGLREPNETRLGMSKGRPSGRGVGAELADQLYESLARSEARKSGLIEDLEDTALMVPGVGPDRISDITTNIVRAPLVDFTERMVAKYGIPTQLTDTGPMWKPGTTEWESEHRELPVVAGRTLLLVPRSVVRWRLSYDPGDYYRHHVLTFLRDFEISRRSPITWVIKSGPRRGERTTTKKAVERQYRRRWGTQKDIAVQATREYPEILERYRATKRRDFGAPLDFAALRKRAGIPRPDWERLLADVTACRPGRRDAHRYHRAVFALLGAVFYPQLEDGEVEVEVDSGTRRIDIVFTNMVQDGFFGWFVAQYRRAAFVSMECKNYRLEPDTPVVDQLQGRLNNARGRLGIVVCRRITDRRRFIERTHPMLMGNENFVLGLDDEDLEELVLGARNNDPDRVSARMRQRLRELVNGP